jgi:hypothetical protein
MRIEKILRRTHEATGLTGHVGVVPLSESDRIEIILSLNKHDVFESELLSC